MSRFSILRKSALVLTAAMAIAIPGAKAGAQDSPESKGLRFAPTSVKTVDALAKKAGGPTERIEIQSTDDHIDYVVKAYTLKKANSDEVFQFVVNAVELEGGKVDRFAPGSSVGLNEDGSVSVEYSGESMLVVTAPEWMIPYLDETIETLDVEGLESAAWGDGAAFVRPKHRKPSELSELIADSVASGLQIFVADDSRNVLYLEDLPSWFPCVIDGLGEFDKPAYQIDTRVRIYEINEEAGKDVGLDWYAWKKAVDGGNLTMTYDNAGAIGSYSANLQAVTAEISFNPLLATEFLNYLVGKGSAKVVTDSRLSLVNGTDGVVESTTVIPYVIRGGGADGPLVDSPGIADYEEGVSVTISPSIGTETMELAISASVSSHLGYTPNQSVPIVTESSVETSLVMEPGKTAVLGGLTRVHVVKEESGVPLLKDIPYIKRLFSRMVERKSTSQIIITVLPSSMEAGAVADVPTEAIPTM